MPRDEPNSPVRPWRAAVTALPVHSPARILVAEDDPEMRRLVVEALRGDGYDVLEAHDGGRLLVELARELAGGARPDLVDLLVTDLRMPVCNGLDIVEQLRSARCLTPVIMMTAFGDAATRDRAHALGAVLFDKPFDVDDLRTAVACLLRRGDD